MLFFEPSNLQSLCGIHHTSEKQRIEAGSKAKSPVGLDGWPLDSRQQQAGVAQSPESSEE